MNDLYDILEICLDELDNGVPLETILARYPDVSAELRPMLQTAFAAKQEAVPAPSQSVLIRNQAKVLQRFDQVWDAKPVTRSWFSFLQQRAVAFALLMILFLFSGTNLVRASFSSLPGDALYPVKRSWEKTTLFFTFDENARAKLELQYEAERLKELEQLFASGRTTHVEFVGVVSLQRGEEWQVANVLVVVSAQTNLPDQAIQNGNLVRVIGTTSGEGVVLAERVELITVSTLVPTETQSESETDAATPQQPGNEDLSSGSRTETPVFHEIETATPTSTPRLESFVGILISIDQSIWKINDILVEASHAEIKGVPVIGATVNAEGYFDADGIFIASKLEIVNNVLNDNNVNSGNGAGDININNVTNSNTNNNSNSNNNDSGGGNSGGGGNDNGGGHGNGG